MKGSEPPTMTKTTTTTTTCNSVHRDRWDYPDMRSQGILENNIIHRSVSEDEVAVPMKTVGFPSLCLSPSP